MPPRCRSRDLGVGLAQINNEEILRRVIADEVALRDGVSGLVDRAAGQFLATEGLYIDYKQQLKIDSSEAVAEFARDVLAFSNTEGGLLVIGVADNRAVLGHEGIDGRKLRDALGPYIGTRVAFDLEEVSVSVQGSTRRLPVIRVRRPLNAFPNLLRKEIGRTGFVRKVKYVKGTLFYRLENETFSESPYEDVEARARELRFSGAAPRTRTSFLLQEDKPGLRLYAPINDRFFGRDVELAELISKFQSSTTLAAWVFR